MIETRSAYEAFLGTTLSLYDISDAAQNARAWTISKYAPKPGLIPLPDGFYTGWGYLEEDGRTKVMFNEEGITPPSEQAKGIFPYFTLSPEDAKRWDFLLSQQVISKDMLEALSEASKPNEYGLIKDFERLSIEELSTTASSLATALARREGSIGNDWNNFRLARVMRRNLLRCEALKYVLSSKLKELPQLAKFPTTEISLPASDVRTGNVK